MFWRFWKLPSRMEEATQGLAESVAQLNNSIGRLDGTVGRILDHIAQNAGDKTVALRAELDQMAAKRHDTKPAQSP